MKGDGGGKRDRIVNRGAANAINRHPCVICRDVVNADDFISYAPFLKTELTFTVIKGSSSLDLKQMYKHLK